MDLDRAVTQALCGACLLTMMAMVGWMIYRDIKNDRLADRFRADVKERLDLRQWEAETDG